MLILEDNTEKTLLIPKTFSFNYDFYEVEITSEITLKGKTIKGLSNISNFVNYYQFFVDLSDLPNNAEYILKVKYHNFILEETILRIGKYENKKIENEQQTKYKQYEY